LEGFYTTSAWSTSDGKVEHYPADEMVNVVKAEVEAATVASPSEVLREAMRVWMRRKEEHKERVAAIRAQVQASLDDPRPSLNSREMRTAINALFAKHQ
jgi:antitoxin ParD1/3/4